MPFVRLIHLMLLLAMVAMPLGMAAPALAMSTGSHEMMTGDHCDAPADQEDERSKDEKRRHCLIACTFLPPSAVTLAAASPMPMILPLAMATSEHLAFNPAAEPPPPRLS